MKSLIPLIETNGLLREESNIDLSLEEQCNDQKFIDFVKKSYNKVKSDVVLKSGVISETVYTTSDPDEYSFILIDNEIKQEDDLAINIKLYDNKFSKFIDILFEKVYLSEFTDEYCKINLLNNYLDARLKNGNTSEIIRHNSVIDYDRAIIIGFPGSGKTTLLRRLACELIFDYKKNGTSQSIPLYIQLRKFDFSLDIIDSIINYYLVDYSSFDKRLLSTILRSNKAIILYDGLDEIDADNREKLLKSTTKKEFKNCKFIISSRESSYLKNINSFVKLYLEPFTNHQIKELAFRMLKKSNWKNFYNILIENKRLLEIVKTPLLLNQALNLYDIKSSNPGNTAILLRNFIETLVETWNHRRGIYYNDNRLNPDKLKYILSKLAYILQTEEKSSFDVEEFKNLFDLSSEQDSEKFLQSIQQYTGLLTYNNEKWEFIHISLQEFFCANYLIEKSEGFTKTYKTFEMNLKWSNIWKTSFGLSLDPEFYIHNTKEDFSVEYIQTLIKLQDILRESVILEKFLVKRIMNKTTSFFENYKKHFDSEKIQKNDNSVVEKKALRFRFVNYDDEKENKSIFKIVLKLNLSILETRWTIYSDDISNLLKNSNSKFLNEINEIYKPNGKTVCQENEFYSDYFLSNEIENNE